MSAQRVVITGLGVIAPIGIGKEVFWREMIAGRNGISEIERFDTSAHRTHRGGEIKDFVASSFMKKERADEMGRASQFAVAATRMAFEDAGIETQALDPKRLGIMCGTTMGESQAVEALDEVLARDAQAGGINARLVQQAPMDMIQVNVAREFGVRGPVNMIPTACAAGNYAIGYATDLLKTGQVEVMVAGGSDPLSRIAFTGFNSMLAVAPEMCQPFDRNRKGMMVSEGAAMLVLEPLERALARGARIYAEVASYGISNDTHHMTAPHPEGKGAVRAMRNALGEAGLEPSQVDYINAHGTGTPANDKVETAAIKQVFGEAAYSTPVSSIKSMIGHTMGAASAIEAVACALAIERGKIPPTINYSEPDPQCDLDYVPNVARERQVEVALSNSFAFGGNCAALILKKFHA
jgi:3-oxoacyl-[acyl-carrier-protein] synthase II